jgi:hypothetical protein
MNPVMTISIKLNTLALSLKLSFFVVAVNILLVHYILPLNVKDNFKHRINMSEISQVFSITQSWVQMWDAISNEDNKSITLAPFVHQQWGWFCI